ncbi:MAG: hypothetical protein M3O87_03065 [Candidatus Dormibacteraeota bacterium]|nr:hypothetical protein [Candidatus Dormibacteraeota bacterium]
MEALLGHLMDGSVSTMVATGLGLAVCAFTVLVVVFAGDPQPEAEPATGR